MFQQFVIQYVTTQIITYSRDREVILLYLYAYDLQFPLSNLFLKKYVLSKKPLKMYKTIFQYERGQYYVLFS